jgi:ABC-type lipoprotein export system ATPase subunit
MQLMALAYWEVMRTPRASFVLRRQIMRLLRTVVRSEGITALVATHDQDLVDLADEVLQLEDGVLTQQLRAAL